MHPSAKRVAARKLQAYTYTESPYIDDAFPKHVDAVIDQMQAVRHQLQALENEAKKHLPELIKKLGELRKLEQSLSPEEYEKYEDDFWAANDARSYYEDLDDQAGYAAEKVSEAISDLAPFLALKRR